MSLQNGAIPFPLGHEINIPRGSRTLKNVFQTMRNEK